ncbi:hypothetical protein PSECIP111854_02159 [Pseudoalteromonas sp. CIP111854]|uniref:Uncharacterized protein n=1 Tax=Pseudoalteromonas holothuriae TaxID=2963714 RepID=A0A9W4VVL6_9GAMM|nr:hypothetical protein [Pseudoalteromonas sp. CIP111854]CAH9058222.1 hypothetical protein PSECIP111854_02159 [Pseudoalteromonas sp. CIP111854]
MRNQNYRVRIKPKIKLKLAVLTLVIISALFFLLWLFIKSDFYNSTDIFEFKTPLAIEPINIRKAGKYPHYDLAKFKLPSGEFTEIQVNTEMAVNNKYCFSRVYKNGKFTRYQIVAYKNCI